MFEAARVVTPERAPALTIKPLMVLVEVAAERKPVTKALPEMVAVPEILTESGKRTVPAVSMVKLPELLLRVGLAPVRLRATPVAEVARLPVEETVKLLAEPTERRAEGEVVPMPTLPE